MCKVIVLFCFLLIFPSWAATHERILSGMTPGSITFIGESFKRIESVNLVWELAYQIVEQGQCLTLALEIAESQQPAIDRVMNFGDSVSDIVIPESIDYRPLRGLIKHIAVLKTRSPCLNVVAVDASQGNSFDPDEWMASKLANLAGESPVLVLIGALHTLKKVNWLVKTAKPSVAERLVAKGLEVRSFPQRWIPDQCGAEEKRYLRYVSAEKPEALVILNDSMMSLLNAKPHKSAKGVIDAFILWECGDQSQPEKIGAEF